MSAAADHAATVEQARKALAYEKWVNWALHEAQDANEGALVYAYRALVALADRATELERERDEAYDEGAEAVRGEIVCSVCGLNHDRDESAACDGCEPMRFDEWAASVGERAERAETALRDVGQWLAQMEGRTVTDADLAAILPTLERAALGKTAPPEPTPATAFDYRARRLAKRTADPEFNAAYRGPWHAYEGVEHTQPGPFAECLLCRIDAVVDLWNESALDLGPQWTALGDAIDRLRGETAP